MFCYFIFSNIKLYQLFKTEKNLQDLFQVLKFLYQWFTEFMIIKHSFKSIIFSSFCNWNVKQKSIYHHLMEYFAKVIQLFIIFCTASSIFDSIVFLLLAFIIFYFAFVIFIFFFSSVVNLIIGFLFPDFNNPKNYF